MINGDIYHQSCDMGKKDTQEYIIYYDTVHNITQPLSASMHKLGRKASWIQ